MVKFEGYEFVDGGVCAAEGFTAAGVIAGIKAGNTTKRDLAMIFCAERCKAAALYTTNKVKGAPIYVTKKHLEDGCAQAVIVNSGNANTCNENGIEIAEQMCELTAEALDIDADDVLVGSTGVIGQPLSIKPIKARIPTLAKELSSKKSSEACEAMPKEFYSDDIDDEVKTHVMNAAKTLEAQGAKLVECSIPGLKYAIPAYYLIACAEAASNLSRFDGIKYGFRGEGRTFEELIRDSRSKGFGEEVKRRILLGNYALSSGYYDAYYKKALALKQQIIKEYNAVFDLADVILTPTAPTPAYKIGAQDNDPVKMYLADICTVTVNIASLPGISTTCGYTAEGLPVGMSVIGRRFDEQTILQCADAFEQTFAPTAPAKL